MNYNKIYNKLIESRKSRTDYDIHNNIMRKWVKSENKYKLI